MKRLIYQVAVGPSRPLWEACIASVARYAERNGFEHRVQREPILRIVPGPPRSERGTKLGYLPELEKFAAWELLGEYDEIAQIDADVYAHEGAPLPGLGTADFYAVFENEIPVNRACSAKLRAYAQGQYGRADAYWYQCGVQVLRPALLDHLGGARVEDMLRAPRWAPYINGEGAFRWSTEQTLLNVWLRENSVARGSLPWQFNAPFGMMGETPEDEARIHAGAYLSHFLCGAHISGHDPEEMLRTGKGRSRI